MALQYFDDEIAAVHFIGNLTDEFDVTVNLIVVGTGPIRNTMGRYGLIDFENAARSVETALNPSYAPRTSLNISWGM